MEWYRKCNFKIFVVVQVSHDQADARYGVSLGIQCPYISLMSINWTLFKLPQFWDLNDLDCELQKWGELFKSVNEIRLFGVEGLPHGFLTENYLIDVDFLENRIAKITIEGYLASITEVISDSQQVKWSGALLIFNNLCFRFAIWKLMLPCVWFKQQRWKRHYISCRCSRQFC